jgi:hypothetical protein
MKFLRNNPLEALNKYNKTRHASAANVHRVLLTQCELLYSALRNQNKGEEKTVEQRWS